MIGCQLMCDKSNIEVIVALFEKVIRFGVPRQKSTEFAVFGPECRPRTIVCGQEMTANHLFSVKMDRKPGTDRKPDRKPDRQPDRKPDAGRKLNRKPEFSVDIPTENP